MDRLEPLYLAALTAGAAADFLARTHPTHRRRHRYSRSAPE